MAKERKVVSVLFVDLVGFTAQSESADPEDVDALLRGYHRDVRHEIERYGGTVEKFIGDAVVAVFGAPAAHEDDPERAVRAALRILDATDLDIRIAVNTGEVLVDLDSRPEQGEGMVTGDAVNTASRLQGAAPLRGILVGEATHAATARAVEYEELEPVEVKGKSQPLAVWRAVGARSRLGIDVDAPAAAPFVGRRRELELLQQLFERCLDESGMQLVTIVGEPGAGKTRLVGELRAWVDERPEIVLWRQGRCLPYGEGIAYWPVGEAVKAQAGILESDDLAATAAKLDLTLEGMPDPDWLRARLAPLLGLEAGSGSRDESFAAWRTFFEELAARSPLILIVEDLHWADPAMLEFVEYLVEWSAGEPMLVIATARPELFERNPGWGGGKRNATTISLSSLSDEDTARLVAALLERSVLPAETQAVLLERAGGNPLFAEEFVRMLRDRGVDDAVVPGNVQALIAARLDTLDPARKQLVHDAAVVGKVFWGGAVAAISGSDRAHVRSELHELVRKELVKPARLSSVEGEQEYVFWHALVRDVAYGQIPRADRIGRHVAAAEWIERVTGDRAGDHAEILAHHYLSAAQLAEATGAADAAPLRSLAVDHLVVAGQRTRNVDSARALQLLIRATDLLDADDPRLPTALAWAARTATEQGDVERARALIDDAYRRALDQGDDLAIGFTQAWRASFLATGRREEMARAVAQLEKHPPGWQLASVLVGLAAMNMLEEHPQDALAIAERALPIVERHGGPGDLPLLLEARAWARSDTGDRGGIEDGRRALQLSLDTNDAHVPTSAVNLAGLQWIWDGPAAAVEMYEFSGREAARRRQSPATTDRELAWVLVELGRWDDALVLAEGCLVWAREHSEPEVLGMAGAAAAVVQVRRGRVDRAVETIDEALDAIRQSPEPQIRQPGLIAAAEVRLAADGRAAARRQLEELVAGRFTGIFTGLHLPSAVATAIATGAAEMARRLIDGSPVYSARLAAGAACANGLLLEAEGDHRAALDLLQRSSGAFADLQMPFERARAVDAAARCLSALGRLAESEPLATEAMEIFQGLGCAPPTPSAARARGRAARSS